MSLRLNFCLNSTEYTFLGGGLSGSEERGDSPFLRRRPFISLRFFMILYSSDR